MRRLTAPGSEPAQRAFVTPTQRAFVTPAQRTFITMDRRLVGSDAIAGMGSRLAAGGLGRRPPAVNTAARSCVEDEWVRRIAGGWTRAGAAARTLPLVARSAHADIAGRLQRVPAATIFQVTALCMIGAIASSTMLYWQKSRAAGVDRDVGRVLLATSQVHAQTEQLRGEWSLLNDPDSLRDLAARHSRLQPIAPAQFVEAAKLPERLQTQPAPVAGDDPETSAATPDAVPDRQAGTAPPADMPEEQVAPEAEHKPSAVPAPPRVRLATAPAIVHAHVRAALTLAHVAAVPPVVVPARPPARQHVVPHVMIAKFEMPHWLSQPRPPRPSVLVMSEPPHTLRALQGFRNVPRDAGRSASIAQILSPPGPPPIYILAPQQRPALASVPYLDRFAMARGRPAFRPYDPYGRSNVAGPYGWQPPQGGYTYQ